MKYNTPLSLFPRLLLLLPRGRRSLGLPSNNSPVIKLDNTASQLLQRRLSPHHPLLLLLPLSLHHRFLLNHLSLLNLHQIQLRIVFSGASGPLSPPSPLHRHSTLFTSPLNHLLAKKQTEIAKLSTIRGYSNQLLFLRTPVTASSQSTCIRSHPKPNRTQTKSISTNEQPQSSNPPGNHTTQDFSNPQSTISQILSDVPDVSKLRNSRNENRKQNS
ncbi:hypothetical protein Droror1_Dr00013420 [Drosera rotundifolia]